MLRLFKWLIDRIRFCGTKYVIEPKYGLFYISEDREEILTCRAPANVLHIGMHRPHGNDIYGSNVVGLSEGDIIKVVVHNYDAHPGMSIMDRAGVNSVRYIRYNGEGNFEELNSEKRYEARGIPDYIPLFVRR